MGIKDRLISAVFGEMIDSQVKERLKAATVSELEKEDIGWRKLTGDTSRSLSPLKQERMIEIAFWLWENNPLARWIIEIAVSFLLAEGLPYETKNKEIKKVLDDFWHDPLNRMDLYIEKHVRELHLYGELCLTVYVAEQTGKVRLGYVDPVQIEEVVTDPENVKLTIGVILKSQTGIKARQLKTILPEDAEIIISPAARKLREGYTDGECFFFAINNVTNSPRGRSELLTTADWLDAYEQFLFDYADKWLLLNSFVWDVEVNGGNPEEIAKIIGTLSKKSGSVFGHNEKVKLTASTPDLKAVDAETGGRILRNHILGSHAYPEHWFGGGGNVNMATAVEMGTPAYKMLSAKQRYFKFILEEILRYVISRARKAKYLNVTDEDARAVTISTPELATKDVAKYAAATQQVSTSLAVAESQGWIDKDTARKVFSIIIGHLGAEIDSTEVKKAVDEEAVAKAHADYLKKPPLVVG